MFGEKEKALLNGGHISKKIKNLGIFFAAIIIAFLMWIYVSYSSAPTLGVMTTQNNNDATSSEDLIAKIQSDKQILLYHDYILINGQRYQIKMENGQIMVLKDGAWIPLSAMSASANGSIISQSGHLYRYINGHLVPLVAGEIIHRGNASYIVGADGKLHKINTDGVVWKDGKPYTVDSMGHLHAIKDGQIVMVNGHPMMWKNGKFIPVDTSSASNGKSNSSLKSTEHKNGSFGVAMGRDGKALYYEYKNGKLVAVPKSSLRAGSIVYYKGKAYRVGKDGKLHALKAGDTIWRNGKLYVVSPSGMLRAVKSGELVDVNGKPFIYKNGILAPLTKKEGEDAVKNKTLSWINGKPYLLDASGHMHAIKDGEIIFRGGQAYRYLNGQFIKLTPAELAAINAPEDTKKKPPVTAEKPTPKPSPELVGNDEELKAALASGFSVTVVKNNTGTTSSANSDSTSGNDGFVNNQQSATNNVLKAIANSSEGANLQASKEAFLRNAGKGGIPSSKTDYQAVTSPYTISMGTTLNASLITGIDSDLPGSITAQVSQNVYDSITGNYLLIPQGTKIIGKYESKVSYGQSRVLLVWTTLLLPDGGRVDLQGQPGVDLQGLAGLTGDVNNHWFSVFKNVLMMSVFGAGVQIAAGGGSGSSSGGGNGTNSSQLIAASLGQQLGQAGLKIIQKSMNIQPTINIKPGDNFKILLTRDFIMPSPYRNFNKPALIFQ